MCRVPDRCPARGRVMGLRQVWFGHAAAMQRMRRIQAGRMGHSQNSHRHHRDHAERSRAENLHPSASSQQDLVTCLCPGVAQIVRIFLIVIAPAFGNLARDWCLLCHTFDCARCDFNHSLAIASDPGVSSSSRIVPPSPCRADPLS
jgi:hypothetical protein